MKKIILTLAVALCAGCSGMEIGGKLGIYRVDERQDSSRTHRKSVPLKCYFVNCNDASEEQGS